MNYSRQTRNLQANDDELEIVENNNNNNPNNDQVNLRRIRAIHQLEIENSSQSSSNTLVHTNQIVNPEDAQNQPYFNESQPPEIVPVNNIRRSRRRRRSESEDNYANPNLMNSGRPVLLGDPRPLAVPSKRKKIRLSSRRKNTNNSSHSPTPSKSCSESSSEQANNLNLTTSSRNRKNKSSKNILNVSNLDASLMYLESNSDNDSDDENNLLEIDPNATTNYVVKNLFYEGKKSDIQIKVICCEAEVYLPQNLPEELCDSPSKNLRQRSKNSESSSVSNENTNTNPEEQKTTTTCTADFSYNLNKVSSKIYKLHKIYLKRSPYFSSLFENPWQDSKNPILTLDFNQMDEKSANLSAAEICLGCLYSDSFKDKITRKNFQNVIVVANFLQLEDVKMICVKRAFDMISTVCRPRQVASRSGACARWKDDLIDLTNDRYLTGDDDTPENYQNQTKNLQNPNWQTTQFLDHIKTILSIYQLAKKYTIPKLAKETTNILAPMLLKVFSKIESSSTIKFKTATQKIVHKVFKKYYIKNQKTLADLFYNELADEEIMFRLLSSKNFMICENGSEINIYYFLKAVLFFGLLVYFEISWEDYVRDRKQKRREILAAAAEEGDVLHDDSTDHSSTRVSRNSYLREIEIAESSNPNSSQANDNTKTLEADVINLEWIAEDFRNIAKISKESGDDNNQKYSILVEKFVDHPEFQPDLSILENLLIFKENDDNENQEEDQIEPLQNTPLDESTISRAENLTPAATLQLQKRFTILHCFSSKCLSLAQIISSKNDLKIIEDENIIPKEWIADYKVKAWDILMSWNLASRKNLRDAKEEFYRFFRVRRSIDDGDLWLRELSGLLNNGGCFGYDSSSFIDDNDDNDNNHPTIESPQPDLYTPELHLHSYYCTANLKYFFKNAHRLGRLLPDPLQKYQWHWSYFTFGINLIYSFDIKTGLTFSRRGSFDALFHNLSISVENLKDDYPLFIKATICCYNKLGQCLKSMNSAVMACGLATEESQVLIDLKKEQLYKVSAIDHVAVQVHLYLPNLNQKLTISP